DFISLADHVYGKGRRVLLVQSGENDDEEFVEHVCRCIRALKREHEDMILILCLGNLERDQYARLREAGAERYILKFETSNPDLYSRWKPRDTLVRRLSCIEALLDVGFALGSGNMIGLPGQTLEDVISDLELLARYDLAMSSCTVFIPGEDSNYRDEPKGDLDTTLNMMALMRIMFPDRLIPTTSSLEKARKGGQLLGLMAGGNTVTIHDGTPEEVKHLFPIYSTKRFAPTQEHIESLVQKAGLRLSPGAMR
ncbi:radical SAM protein, partial [Verrucomicrobiota bacterium]